jgi:hypothetical protein
MVRVVMWKLHGNSTHMPVSRVVASINIPTVRTLKIPSIVVKLRKLHQITTKKDDVPK